MPTINQLVRKGREQAKKKSKYKQPKLFPKSKTRRTKLQLSSTKEADDQKNTFQ